MRASPSLLPTMAICGYVHADPPFSPCGRRWIGAERAKTVEGCWPERQAGTPLIRPSFARPPSPTRGEGRALRFCLNKFPPLVAGVDAAGGLWVGVYRR